MKFGRGKGKWSGQKRKWDAGGGRDFGHNKRGKFDQKNGNFIFKKKLAINLDNWQNGGGNNRGSWNKNNSWGQNGATKSTSNNNWNNKSTGQNSWANKDVATKWW